MASSSIQSIPFVRRFDWHGILVEPLGDVFTALRENYAGSSGLIFENVAITEADETRMISRVPLDRVGRDGVPGWAYGASTLMPEKTRFAKANSPTDLHAALTQAKVEESVTCLNLNSLLARHQVERIDLLLLDTEGYDAKILNQLDFSRFKPSLINMEWQWLTEDERRQVTEMLRHQGYSLYGVGPDLLAALTSIEALVTSPDPPTAATLPRYFPGVIGIQPSLPVDSGACASTPERCEVLRYRGTSISFCGAAWMYNFLMRVDGRSSYGEIALAMSCEATKLLKFGRELQAAYVLE